MIDPLTGQEESRGAWHARYALPRATVVALAGLLGILVGEQIPSLAKRLIHREPVIVDWAKAECLPRMFGQLPTKVAAKLPSSRMRLEHVC
jgi:xanthosine utilization system XapX-like protein